MKTAIAIIMAGASLAGCATTPEGQRQEAIMTQAMVAGMLQSGAAYGHAMADRPQPQIRCTSNNYGGTIYTNCR